LGSGYHKDAKPIVTISGEPRSPDYDDEHLNSARSALRSEALFNPLDGHAEPLQPRAQSTTLQVRNGTTVATDHVQMASPDSVCASPREGQRHRCLPLHAYPFVGENASSKAYSAQLKIASRDLGASSRDVHTSVSQRSSSCPQPPLPQTRPLLRTSQAGKSRKRVEFAQQACWVHYEVDEIGRAPVVKMRAIRGDGPGVRVLLGGDGGPLEAMHKTSFPRPDDCRPQASQCEAALFPRDSQIEKSASLGASLFFPATCRDSCNKDRPRHARKCSLAKVAPSSTCSLTGSAQTICAQMHPPTVVRAW